MVKTKSVLIYVIAVCFALLLFSSFEAENYFAYSTKLDISDKMMYHAFTSDMENLNASDAGTNGESEKKAESYKLFDSSQYIKNYKFILYYLGFLQYPEDGKFDETLQSAVLTYQQSKNLEVNGVLNSATMAALDAEPLTYKEGQKGDAVLKYQKILKDLKYLPEETGINGTFGSETTSAVASYQQNNHLNVTGTLNSETRTALDRNLTDQVPAK